MTLLKQVIVLVIGALFIAGLALLWAWGSSRNGDENCGMSCADCSNSECEHRKG